MSPSPANPRPTTVRRLLCVARPARIAGAARLPALAAAAAVAVAGAVFAVALAAAGLAVAPGAAFAGSPEPPQLPAGIARQPDGRLVAEKDGAEQVYVPAGDFIMGSDDGGFDERPAHRVGLGAFLIDRCEVTNARFARFVRESGYRPAGPWARGSGPGEDERPVRFVTWHDAAAYARWAGRALPTEAQWEKAARGEAARRYPWGEDWREGAARADLDLDAGPGPVAAFPSGASPYGCLDMAGNVWEWAADWYDRRAYEARAGGAPVVDPAGPPDGAPPEERFVSTGTGAGNERSTRKAIRGGGWVAVGRENARTSKRAAGNPRSFFDDTGFRCALPLPAGAEGRR